MKKKTAIFVMIILAILVISTLIYVADIDEHKSEGISKYYVENISKTFASLNNQEIEQSEINLEDANKSLHTLKKSLNHSDNLTLNYVDNLSECLKISIEIVKLSEEGNEKEVIKYTDDFKKRFQELKKLGDVLNKVNPDIARALNVDRNNMEFEQIRLDLEDYKKELENNITFDSISFKGHEKQYKWENHKVKIKISDGRYNYYTKLHRNQSDYSNFVTHEDAQIKELSNYFDSISDEEEKANSILSFVQNVPFVTEPEGEDFWKYPIETLIEGGDCEDHAFLFASIAKQSGYDVAIIVFDEHKMAGIMLNEPPKIEDVVYYLFDGNEYYACETSGGVFTVGKVSNEYRGEYYYIFPV
ncbi:MAG: hypothetical protein C5S40_05940 [ANME-2 cluster archaeon]|nr:hypothetical protein [ANME-2 cluster archaeon]